jgi:hypothetical protein
MRRAGELLGVLARHLLDAANPGCQTEALERTVHIVPTASRLGTSAGDEGMVVLVMALLFFADSTPRA